MTVDATGSTQQAATPNGTDATPLTEAVVLLLAEKDARIADQVEVIADLRRRLDALLPDRRPWWRRWFR